MTVKWDWGLICIKQHGLFPNLVAIFECLTLNQQMCPELIFIYQKYAGREWITKSEVISRCTVEQRIHQTSDDGVIRHCCSGRYGTPNLAFWTQLAWPVGLFSAIFQSNILANPKYIQSDRQTKCMYFGLTFVFLQRARPSTDSQMKI